MKSSRLLVLLVVAACGSAPPPQAQRGTPAPMEQDRSAAREAYAEFTDEFLAWYYAAHPVRATELGLHEHDGRLPDYSRRAIQSRIDELLEWLRRLGDLEPRLLELGPRIDLQLMESAIRDELLDLEEVRVWASNPKFYHDAIATGVDALVTAGTLAPDDRARNLVARMQAVPELLAAARENLSHVPRLWAELGVQDARATAGHIRGPVLQAVLESDSIRPMLRGQLEGTADRAATALEQYAAWLETDVVPAAGADFRLGRYIFLRKLLYQEHVRLNADELARISEQTIQTLRTELWDAAAVLDADRTPGAILDSLAGSERAADEMVAALRDRIREAREFVETRELLTLPDAPLPTVRVAPGHVRGQQFTLEMPGPFEDGEAFLDVTVEADSAGALHVARLGPAELTVAAVHHVMPGHFVQKAYVRTLESDARKTFQPRSLAEGWAHYMEETMVEEGWGDDDPAVRIVWLRRTLERHARWDAGLHMHAFDETVDEAVRRFQRIAYVDEPTARRQVARGTWDPIYLSDALGRMQLLELRKEYQDHLEERREEDRNAPAFSDRRFHDAFLRQGLPPTLARLALMPRPEEEAAERRGRRVPVRIPPQPW